MLFSSPLGAGLSVCLSVTCVGRTVWAGKVPIGSEHPIALQTMATTDTRDVMATVEQVGEVLLGMDGKGKGHEVPRTGGLGCFMNGRW